MTLGHAKEIFVTDLARSQIRKSVFEALSRIDPANRPPQSIPGGSTRTYGTKVQWVTDSWVTPSELPSLPAVQFRFARTVYDGRQSMTLGATIDLLVRVVVGLDDSTDESLLGARLDLLIDDVIAAMMGSYRSGGFSYAVYPLEDEEHDPIKGGKRAATLRFQIKYTRRYTLDSRETER